MEEIVIYLGKVAIATVAFYVVFQFLFRSWKNFSFNRQYMLGSMIIPFILPLITFTIVREAAPTFVLLENSGAENVMNTMPTMQKTISNHQIILIIYFTGLAFFLLRLLAGHIKAIQILRKSRKKQINGIPLYIYPAEIHPFAFFNKIAMPESVTHNPAFDLIVKHELVHTKENHWIDNLLSEIICAIQWFNPFSWLMKNALKSNLEFQADEKAVAGNEAETYQLALVSMANKAGIGTFLTAINSSDLKTRIKMMKKKTGNRYAVARQLVVLPLLALLVMGLANREVKTVVVQSENQLIQGFVSNESGEPLAGTNVILKGTSTGTISDINGNFVIQVESDPSTLILSKEGYDLYEITLNGISEFSVELSNDDTPKTYQIKIIENNNLNSEIVGRVLSSDTSESDKFSPHAQVSDKVIRKPEFPGGEAAFELPANWQKSKAGPIELTGDPVYIVDGKEFKGNISEIKVDDILNITVLKGKEAIEKFGDKATGGVIIIETKQKKTNSGQEPLVIVNGAVHDLDINSIDPATIERIDVLKEKSATAIYGEKGQNGVILITLLNNVNSTKVESGRTEKGITIRSSDEISQTITNAQQLRRAIAERIKYPVSAQEAGQTGRIEIYAEINREGKINQLSETAPAVPFETLDEVVIIAYASENPVSSTADLQKTLIEESKRVIQSFPKIEIPDIQGKWVKMQFNFVLQ